MKAQVWVCSTGIFEKFLHSTCDTQKVSFLKLFLNFYKGKSGHIVEYAVLSIFFSRDQLVTNKVKQLWQESIFQVISIRNYVYYVHYVHYVLKKGTVAPGAKLKRYLRCKKKFNLCLLNPGTFLSCLLNVKWPIYGLRMVYRSNSCHHIELKPLFRDCNDR